MKAAVQRRFGGPEVVRIEEVRKPTPCRGEVMIRVHASTVSAADHRARTKDVPKGLTLFSSLTLGFFAPRIRVLGMDVAGVVESVGTDVTGWSPGDHVIAHLGATFGGHSEYVTVPQDGAIAGKPSNLTFEESAALVFGGITAQAFLKRTPLEPGASVLIIGASGAVGTAAVQLANARGAQVTAVCSGRNADLVRSLGAWRVIDYTTDDLTGGSRTYDIVVDCVGGIPFERLGPLINPGGALLSVAFDLVGLLAARRRSRRTGIHITAGSVPFSAADLSQVARLAGNRLLLPVIDQTFDLPLIAEAHRYVDSGRKKGSVVIRITPEGSRGRSAAGTYGADDGNRTRAISLGS